MRRMRWRTAFALVLLALAGALLGSAVRDARDEQLEQLRALAASGWEVRALEPHEYTDAVERKFRSWLDPPGEEPPGEAPPKPVQLARGYKLGDGFVVEERTTGQWLLGQAVPDKPGRLACAGRYVSFAALVASNGFAPAPDVPRGWRLREVVRMPDQPTRMTSDAAGNLLYVLTLHGDVYKLDPNDGSLARVVDRAAYLRESGEYSCMGICFDAQGRLYIVANYFDEHARPQMNRVTIFRAEPGKQAEPKPWFETAYPYGVDVFNHGVGHIAPGPDGFLYVNSGSRTDHGEAGTDPRRGAEGETPITACIWRLDPRAAHPQIEVFAHGLRNAYGFCWDDRGRMRATDNGPSEAAPEELNFVERGRHYGFPYTFANLAKSPYPDTPPAPQGLEMIGPAATFDDHSSPAGIVYLGSRFPPQARDSFLVVRFGNLLPVAPVGQDLLQVRLGDDGRASVKPLISGLSRPVDIHRTASGRVFIVEVFRRHSELPGRIWELSAGDF